MQQFLQEKGMNVSKELVGADGGRARVCPKGSFAQRWLFMSEYGVHFSMK